MSNSISQLQTQGLSIPQPTPPTPPGATSEGASFKNVLLDSIQQVNTMQQDANRAVEQLAAGGDVSPAEVFTAVQKADLAFRMMMQVRNKLVSAYQEVQNVRV